MLNSQQLHHHQQQQQQPPSSIQINNNNNNLLTSTNTTSTTIIADNIITTDNVGSGGGGVGAVVGGGGGGVVVGTGVGNNTNSGSGYFIFDKISSALQERSQQNDYELSTTPSSTQHTNIALSSASSSSSSTSSAATASTATAVAMAMQSISKNFQQQQHTHHIQHPHQPHQQQQHQSHQQQLQYHQQQHLHQHQQLQHQHLQHHQNSHQQQLQKCCYGGDTTYHFKTLVPSVAAGAIIGKGGETIAAIQKETGARVKMSKSHDFYPGTTERVCLITGSTEAIVTVVEFIMDKIREKPDLTTKSSEIETKQAQERDKQVKILVPNSTAGMIIGKAGAFIKQIKEESGSYIQISQKPKDMTLQERCITIIGDKDSNKAACKMILAKIVEDPQSGTCLNVSYSDVNGPVANFNPTGSPYAINQNSITASNASLNSAVSGSGGLLTNGAGINLSLNLGQSNTPNAAVTSQILEHIKMTMRSSGFSETATNEVCSALGILAKYGVLGVNLGVPHSNGAHAAALGYLGVNPLEQSVSGSGVFGAIGQVNMDSFMSPTTPQSRPSLERFDGPFEAFRHANTHATTPISLNNNTYGLATGGATAQAINAAAAAAAAQQALGNLNKSPPPSEGGSKDTRNVEIPEIIVGAILGPNGRSLIEIQNMSGATVQISKKGMFAPGTRNRIVTITGPPNAITMAHILIEQKITEEESKRARQNPVAGIMP